MSALRWIWEKGLRPVTRIIFRAGEEFWLDGCMTRAASLSYTTLLSLIPLLAVSFSIYSSFGNMENNVDQVRDFVFKQVNPGSLEGLDGFFNSVKDSSDKAAAVGILGVIALIMSAWALLSSVENSFNFIWQVKKHRTLVQRFVAYTAFIFWVPIMISLSIYLTTKLQIYFFGENAPDQSGMFKFWIRMVPFVLTWAAFYFAYTAIPNCSVHWRAALVSSLVAGLLWELAKVGFEQYITKISSFSKIYGALGTVPLFMLWVYYSWLIVMFGSELSYVLTYPKRRSRRSKNPPDYSAYYALKLMISVSRRFKKGQPPANAKELSKELGLDEEPAGLLLNRLTKEGLVVCLSENDPRYSLGKDPGCIPIKSIIGATLGETLGIPDGNRKSEEQALSEVLKDARLEQDTTLSQKTLADLM